ncbi:UNVERIFIED_ORG: hypothetical protein J2X79_004229 [Arthrobacter globiformis]|nr:hypothetical protein [Arthrobacter globiformis]
MTLIDSHDVTYPGRVWSVEAVRRQHGNDAELADPSQHEGGKGRSFRRLSGCSISLGGAQSGKKEGVHNVHTSGFGFGCIGGGLVRTGDVFGGVAGFQGLEPGSSPTSGTCFRRSAAFERLSVDKFCCEGPLRGPFSLVSGYLLAFLDRRIVLRYLFIGAAVGCSMI